MGAGVVVVRDSGAGVGAVRDSGAGMGTSRDGSAGVSRDGSARAGRDSGVGGRDGGNVLEYIDLGILLSWYILTIKVKH